MQVVFGYDELSEGYDASFALDEIQFIGCELPPWQEECPEEFHCGNGVRERNVTTSYRIHTYFVTFYINS